VTVFLSNAQIRTLTEVKAAGRAVRVWRSQYGADWSWRVNGEQRTRTVSNLLDAGCLAINDNDRHTATVTALGRTVLAEVEGSR
jgi:hypothetical protein